MTNTNRPIRRGAALLIVLAALILTVTASASLAGLASTLKMQRTLDHAAIGADDLLRATEAPIIAWLESESAQVVLPPEVEAPRIDVLHDTWSDGKLQYELTVTAWDQYGMVPINLARSGSPLRQALPTVIRRAFDRVQTKPNEPPGLDLFRDTFGATDNEMRIFPRADSTEPIVFADALNSTSREDIDPRQPPAQDQPTPLAIGALVSTHSGGRININTAPPELLEQAFRGAGRGGFDSVLAARAEGRSVSLGDLPTSSSSSTAPQIVGSSSAWSCRIDIRVGPLRRSWWAVYVKSRSNWECVQRLAIAE